MLAIASITLTGCLHIIEEVTVKNNGSGSYKLTLDMSEIKGMMEMLNGMDSDSTAVPEEGAEAPTEMSDNSMSQMGEELSNVAKSLHGVAGLTNIQEINDTAAFYFGYSFDFQDIASLNRALKIINKEKYETNTGEVFKLKGKTFERLATSDLGEEIKKALSESGAEEEESNMEMVKMFFADMSYKQIYNFPERTIKKSSNTLSEVSGDKHSVSILIKPFDEEQQKQKVTIGTVLKLK